MERDPDPIKETEELAEVKLFFLEGKVGKMWRINYFRP